MAINNEEILLLFLVFYLLCINILLLAYKF